MITTDTQAWLNYPFHRNWFNKLWVSEKFKYNCGPNGVPVPVKGEYIMRPVYNLHGMGAGAKFVYLETDDIDTVPPGYFWCEKFEGEHLSIDLFWKNNKWCVGSVFKGLRFNDNELYRFNTWIRVERDIKISHELNELWDCEIINIETIGNKIIEVHLRGSPDPIEYNEMIPVWNDTPAEVILSLSNSHKFIHSYDYVHGTTVYRRGFFCR